MSDLVDVWFTLEQLKTIKLSLSNYYRECSSDVQLELDPIIDHIDHLIKHYNLNEHRIPRTK